MNKTLHKIFMVIQGLLIVFCVLGCIYTIVMGSGGGAQQLPAFIILAALAAMIFYALSGYKKSAAKVYKIVLLLCAAASLLCILPPIYHTEVISVSPQNVAFAAIGHALCFGLFLILALVPDLGYMKSNIIIVVIFAYYIILFLGSMIRHPGALFGDGTRYDTMRILRLLCMWILTVSIGICNYFKYQDKAARGSK